MIKIANYEGKLDSEISELMLSGNLSKVAEHKSLGQYGPFACADWIIPTLVTVHIVSPFFKSIVSELGKDAYAEIKAQFASFSGETKKKERIEPTLGLKKLERKFSHELSFSAKIFDNRTLKLMFPVGFTESEHVDAVACFFDFLRDLELGIVSLEAIGVELERVLPRRSIGVVYDPELMDLRWYDPMPPALREEIRKELQQKYT